MYKTVRRESNTVSDGVKKSFDKIISTDGNRNVFYYYKC